MGLGVQKPVGRAASVVVQGVWRLVGRLARGSDSAGGWVDGWIQVGRRVGRPVGLWVSESGCRRGRRAGGLVDGKVRESGGAVSEVERSVGREAGGLGGRGGGVCGSRVGWSRIREVGGSRGREIQ